jgi:hypothetical protein
MIDKEQENRETISIENTEMPLIFIEEFLKSTLDLDTNIKDGTTKRSGNLTLEHALPLEFHKKCAQLNSKWNSFISNIKKQKLNGPLLTKLIKKAGIL